jgi:NADPH-dependent glutamate synthase beta subunit-like oxidoreductase
MRAKTYHFVAVIGGAIAGSVAAEILADNGIHVVVIEQNKRPYGKIEDGLPRWHLEQRQQEYSRIDARLRKPGVFFLPCTKLGRDLDFQDLCDNWGFSTVILANGAWRDRELGIRGAEEFVDKGFRFRFESDIRASTREKHYVCDYPSQSRREVVATTAAPRRFLRTGYFWSFGRSDEAEADPRSLQPGM